MKRYQISGVSLLEVLISLAIMSAIAVLLSMIGQTGAQAWKRVPQTNSENDSIVRLELIRQLEELPLVASERPLESIFDYAPMASGATIRLPGEGSVLSWSASGVLFVNENTALAGGSLFSSDVAVNVSFYGAKSPRSSRAWFSDWDGASILPLLIKIEASDSMGLGLAPVTIQPGKYARQREISLSSLVPPG